MPEQPVAGYTYEAMRGWVERSRETSGSTLDLVQLHCPPTDLYYRPEVVRRARPAEGRGQDPLLGVSVERIEEALKAIEFRRRERPDHLQHFPPAADDLFFDAPKAREIAVIARVPLASGLLTGKLRPDSAFAESDHRQFNRHGEAFDVGETFAGVPFEVGLRAVERIRPFVRGNARWPNSPCAGS